MKITSYTSNEICVEFKVWAPTINRITHRVYLLGSDKELGAWAIESALPAYPTKDLHIWKVQVAITPMTRFEWVWLKSNVKSKRVEWERPVKRNRAVGCFSGVLHTVWGENEELFLQAAANVELTTFKRVDDGYILVLTGSSTTLGTWDLNRAILANEFPKKSGYWKASFSFDAFTNVTFKWAVVKEKDRDSIQVIEKVPHQICGRPTWMRVAAPWMTSSTVVVDIHPLDDLMDTHMGRTDLLIRERKRRIAEIRTWLVKAREALGLPTKSNTSDLTRTLSTRTAKSAANISTASLADRGLSVTPSLKKLRDEAIDEGIKKRTESLARANRLTRQLSKNFRSYPKTFFIKGKGQKEVPIDIINSDLPHPCSLVPEGECLILGQPPHCPAVLLDQSSDQTQLSTDTNLKYTLCDRDPPLSTDALRPSGEAGGEDDRVESGSYGRSTVEIEQQQGASALETLPQGFDSQDRSLRSHNGVERMLSVARCGYTEHGMGDWKVGCEREVCRVKRADTTGETPTKTEEDCAQPLSCAAAQPFSYEIAQPMQTKPEIYNKNPDEVNDDFDLFSEAPGEIYEDEGVEDATEFFKSLEKSHNKEHLLTTEADCCDSDFLMGDSGLASFGADAKVSASGIESTLSDTGSLSLEDGLSYGSHRGNPPEFNSVEYTLLRSRDLGQTPATPNRHPASSSDTREEDEGFSESDTSSVSSHVWLGLRARAGPFDTSCGTPWWEEGCDDQGETSTWLGSSLAYWQLLHHHRQLAAPSLATSTTATPTDPTAQHFRETPMPSFPGHEEGVAPYIAGITPQLPSARMNTLGNMYYQHDDLSNWRCWARADLEEEDWDGESEFDETEELKAPREIGEMYEDVYDFDHKNRHPEGPVGTSQSVTFMSPALSPHFKPYVAGEPDMTAVEEFASRPIGGENGDAEFESRALFCSRRDSRVKDQTTQRVLSLQSIPCDNLTLDDRREIARALERNWVQHTTPHRFSRESTPPSECLNSTKTDQQQMDNTATDCDGVKKNAMEVKSPISSGRQSGLRRRYKRANYSPTDLLAVVDQGGSMVDRRAVARLMEKAWGEAASSQGRCTGSWHLQKTGPVGNLA